jgi:hypothetical protein
LCAAVGSYSGVGTRESKESTGLTAMGAGRGEPQESTEEEGDAMIKGTDEGEKSIVAIG